MGKSKTKYKAIWKNTHFWVDSEPGDEFSARCTLCECKFDISNQGYSSLNKHASGLKHKSKVELRNCQTDQRILEANKRDKTVELSKPRKNPVQRCLTLKEKASRAACIYALKVVDENFSFRSNDGNNELFQAMFEDSPTAKHYSMHSSKCSYIITHGIAPYVRKEISKDAKNSPFAYLFDETTNAQVRKQYDGYITYFSEHHEKVITRYLGSIFSGHCTSDDLLKDFIEILKKGKVDAKYLLQFGMDGPNVNRSFHRKADNYLRENYSGKTILDLGSCNLHKVNNSFLAAIDSIDFNYDMFACDLCFFFKISSGRREDFAQMSLETEIEAENMLQHSKIRWLSIGRSAQRIIDQWSNIYKYFNEYLPSKKNEYTRIKSTERFKSIVKIVKSKDTKAYLCFVVYVCSLVDDFIKLFQKSEPVCHLVYPAIGDLFFKVLTNVVTPKELCRNDNSRKTTNELGKTDINKASLLNLDSMFFGQETKIELNKIAKEGTDVTYLKTGFKKAYITLFKSLQESLPWKNENLRYLQYLHPSLKTDPKASSSIGNLANAIYKALPKTGEIKISHAKTCEQIDFEFKVFQTSTLPEFDPKQRIDTYWHSIGKLRDLQGNLIYENLSRFVKICLVLSVGNAEPERGFSENKQLLEGRGKLDEKTIEALRLIKNEISLHSVATLIPITDDLLEHCNDAHRNYTESLKVEKTMTEKVKSQALAATEQKKKMEAKELIEANLRDLRKQLALAKEMTNEGEALLITAGSTRVVNKDMLFRATHMITTSRALSNDLELKIATEEDTLKSHKM